MKGRKSILHIYSYLIPFLLICDKAYSQSIHYSIDLLNTRSKAVTVGIEFKKIGVDSLSYQMPLWAPGAYFSIGYGRFVDNFAAYDDNGDKSSGRIPDNLPDGQNIAGMDNAGSQRQDGTEHCAPADA